MDKETPPEFLLLVLDRGALEIRNDIRSGILGLVSLSLDDILACSVGLTNGGCPLFGVAVRG